MRHSPPYVHRHQPRSSETAHSREPLGHLRFASGNGDVCFSLSRPARGKRGRDGPHGYISPAWYDGHGFIPTWDHATAHLYGTPELLSPAENMQVLTRLVDHFEQHVLQPCSLHQDLDLARRVALGTVGLRLRATRFDARLKLSQNKPRAVVARIDAELEDGRDHPYRNRRLAREFRLHFGDEG